MLVGLFLLFAYLSGSALAQRGNGDLYCQEMAPFIPQCDYQAPRDILFILDASNSMNRDHFYSSVLNYTLFIYCSFNPTLPNKIGMMVFAQEIKMVIPMGQYSFNEWYNKVWDLKDSKDGPNPLCCSCCTPTADAFALAEAEFDRVRSTNCHKIAFVITDGVPSNNNPGTPGINGNPDWWFFSAAQGYNPAWYNTRAVPQTATSLKASGVRLMLVGVPDFDGNTPDIKYFNGGYPNNHNLCVERIGITFCDAYKTSNPKNFPLVSLPVKQNSFSTTTWDDPAFILSLVEAICERPVVDQIDLNFLVDRSNSMTYHPGMCENILSALYTPFPSGRSPQPCWELWLQYMNDQVNDFLVSKAGAEKDRQLGWGADFDNTTQPAYGLRVNMVGFACENKQKTPKMFDYTRDINGGPVDNQEDWDNLIRVLLVDVLPFGGTCPWLAIEQVVKTIEMTDVCYYPMQTTLLMTDGVFYDGNAPPRATQGLEYYHSLQYAVGIAIQTADQKWGMTPEEAATQVKQLSSFVNGQREYFYNLKTGYAGLKNITKTIVDSLPARYIGFGTGPPARFSWCGYRRSFNCKSDKNRNGFCKWTGGAKGEYKCRAVKTQ